MPIPPFDARTPRPTGVDDPVEVLSRFDRRWHAGFRIHEIDTAGDEPRVRLSRADGTLIPGSFGLDTVRLSGDARPGI